MKKTASNILNKDELKKLSIESLMKLARYQDKRALVKNLKTIKEAVVEGLTEVSFPYDYFTYNILSTLGHVIYREHYIITLTIN